MTANPLQILSEREQRTLERVLQGIDRSSARSDSLYSRLRKHDRLAYRATISIALPPADGAPFPEHLEVLPVGWAYSLSQGGIGFVSLHHFQSDRLSVGLHLPGGVKWKTGRVVRLREIPQERYFDYGLAFGTNS